MEGVKNLKSHPKNRNKHPEDQLRRLAEILKYQGWRYPIKVSKRSGFVTSGHGRIEAAKINGWKKKGTHNWYADRKQDSVFEIDRPHKSDLHPTTKPVELFEKFISNSTKPGDLIFESFGGSGTTLIASEKLNRKSNSMELDPKYCDVIVARWEKYTGKKAELLTHNNEEVTNSVNNG